MSLASRLVAANRKFFLGSFLLLLIVMGGNVAKASATGDCDTNSVISCGITSPSNLVGRTQQKDSGNGHMDLPLIYAHYGLAPADYNRFITTARPGTAYRDGRIVVDGQVVATGAKSVGRIASMQGPGYFSTPIAGVGTLYGNTSDKAFAAGTNSIPVTVMFNAQGAVEFAVLNSCGNPIYGNNVTPTYSCNYVHATAVPSKPGVYSFTTSAAAGNNASIVKVVYNFGDGTTAEMTNPSDAIQHQFRTNGNFTVRATVYVKLPGNQTITVTSANCATVVTVALPYYQCVQLLGAAIGTSKYQFRFTITGKAGNGAKLTSADFTFGDGSTAKGVGITGGTTATTTHTYTKDGTVSATATFHVEFRGKTTTVTSAGCATKVPVAVPYYSCIQLGGAILDASKFSYSFTVSAKYGNGATFTGADFDFGDNTSTKNVKPSGTSATTTHTYAAAGNYTATATLHFNVNGSVKNFQCTASLTPTQPPTPECKPGVPQGSALCSPCVYDSSIQSTDTEHCVAPITTLPNTGAGDVIAIFGAAAVGGFLIFRQFIYKRHDMAPDGTMTMEGLFAGPVVSEDTGVVVSHHATPKHARKHPNAVHPLHHPTYQQPHRFRPRSHQDDKDS
jgi:hypothetical protein